MQETNRASDATTAAKTGASADLDSVENAAIDALRAELAKWQERVPKLAAALRERTSEVEALKAQLAGSGEPAGDRAPSSGIQARDALIRELEAKVKALGGKYQDAEGQLRSRDLEINQLREETEEWRGKWGTLTAALDKEADGAEQKEREIKRLQGELDELLAVQETHKGRIREQDLELTALRERSESLQTRNQNLFETTELANRQIETLGENLAQLRSELGSTRQALSDEKTRSSDGAREIEALEGQIGSRDQDIISLQARLEEKQAEIATLTERLVELDSVRRKLEEVDAEKSALNASISAAREETAAVEARLQHKEEALDVLRQEIGRLEACVAAADEATGRFQSERRALSAELEKHRRRNEHLETQLTERSNLVVGLEQEKTAIAARASSLETENERLTVALEKAEKSAAGNAEHIAHVDARLERQKQLMDNLETEFAEIQEEYADAVKAHQRALKEKEAEVAASQQALAEEVASLEQQLLAQSGARKDAEAALAAVRSELEEQRILAQRAAEDAPLQAEVIKLEAMLRERTQQLDKLRWQQDMLQEQRIDDPSDKRLLMVLNQQLQAARSENDKLRQTIRGVEAERTPARGESSAGETAGTHSAADDLARIKGIGPKLVQQLTKLGITRFEQIAELSESDLDDAGHPLHGMKGRVLKDDWIGQAVALRGVR